MWSAINMAKFFCPIGFRINGVSTVSFSDHSIYNSIKVIQFDKQ